MTNVETTERMRIDEPESARELAAVMRAASPARRSNPPGDLLFEVSAKAPDWGDQWVVLVGGIGDLDVAIDEARGASLWSLPIWTALRVRASSDPWWVGVVDDRYEVRDAPKLPSGFLLAEDWVSAWEGPSAGAAWMLSQCGRVDQRAVVRACLACVTPHLGEINVRLGTAPLDRRPKEAIRWLETWLEGKERPRVTAEVLAGFRTELRLLANDARSTRAVLSDGAAIAERRYFVLAALSGICEVAAADSANDVAWSAENVASDVAGVVRWLRPSGRPDSAGSRSEADRSLAPTVRSVISVGEVMAARFRKGPKPWRAKGLR
jgi:hypothetical protein